MSLAWDVLNRCPVLRIPCLLFRNDLIALPCHVLTDICSHADDLLNRVHAYIQCRPKHPSYNPPSSTVTPQHSPHPARSQSPYFHLSLPAPYCPLLTPYGIPHCSSTSDQQRPPTHLQQSSTRPLPQSKPPSIFSLQTRIHIAGSLKSTGIPTMLKHDHKTAMLSSRLMLLTKPAILSSLVALFAHADLCGQSIGAWCGVGRSWVLSREGLV